MKTCRICLKELPLNKFPKNRDARKKRGYTIKSDCYDCHSKKNLDYYHRTKLPLKRDWLYNNPDYQAFRKKEIRRYMRKYYKLFVNPHYKRIDVRPKINYTTPSPSPEDWQATSEASQQRILARYG